MNAITSLYSRVIGFISGAFGEGISLLLVRIALAAQFWISGRTKVEEGTWLSINEVQYIIFENEFSGLPLSPEIAVPVTTYAEFLFPLLLFAGLFTRFAAGALLVMTLVIQFFVFPDAWWSVHVMWTALAAILISRGGGLLALDRVFDGLFKSSGKRA